MAILSVIEWADQGPQEIVRRVPAHGSGEFRLGSQLVVRENQAAVFYRDGKALDTFGPGRHTLSTLNLPLLDRLVRLPFGESPFKAEVYFVSIKQYTDMKWGTPQPITMRDADLGMVRLRAFGSYGIQIEDPALFVNTIVGTRSLYETREIADYLRSIIVSRLTDLLGTMQLPLLDLPGRFTELAAATKSKIREEFSALGIRLRGFYVENISPTEETQRAIDERAAMGAIGDMQAYMQYKAARAIEEAAANAGGEGGEGNLTGAGFGLGAGAGLGAMMAQILGQSMQQPQPAPAPASGGETPVEADEPPRPEGGSVETAFTALELLISRQLAVPEEHRNQILQKLAAIEVELGKEASDLLTIKQHRNELAEGWPWMADELDRLFRQPAVERAMAEATRRFMER